MVYNHGCYSMVWFLLGQKYSVLESQNILVSRLQTIKSFIYLFFYVSPGEIAWTLYVNHSLWVPAVMFWECIQLQLFPDGQWDALTNKSGPVCTPVSAGGSGRTSEISSIIAHSKVPHVHIAEVQLLNLKEAILVMGTNFSEHKTQNPPTDLMLTLNKNNL